MTQPRVAKNANIALHEGIDQLEGVLDVLCKNYALASLRKAVLRRQSDFAECFSDFNAAYALHETEPQGQVSTCPKCS